MLWTLAVRRLDLRPIGPWGFSVGFAGLNGRFHRLTGIHMGLYTVTDWLGLVPLVVALGFALLGLFQLIRRKSLWKADRSLLVLGRFYLMVMGAYLFFERTAVNYRPVLIDGYLEASYPSSTTMLALCVLPTAMLQLKERIRSRRIRRGILVALGGLTALWVLGRLISGVYWVTDIIGGGLFSTGGVLLYQAVCSRVAKGEGIA